ncbi:recombinase family protein [Tepidibacter mesophilus]|uniref:recombinase family protein n=1 Tax=Tepidibacter mesophilus TaxID=655607 RepID=UPI000C080057|nr:recombinase family protein [Tepidibacter mesophilus]
MEREINNVVIYLRKSRGDDMTVLDNHKLELVEYANKNGWKYNVFEEVVSGERLANRPKMQKVLDLIEQGLYDGILVMDIDRLTRGNMRELGEIIEVINYANIPIITPTKTYDVSDIGENALLGIKGTFSHMELKKIIERLINGKKAGAKKGNWTNGTPPYPYEYIKKVSIDAKGKEQIWGKLVVNEEKRKVYESIKDMYLSGTHGFEAISFYLNNQNISSPNSKLWSSNTVQRILLHELHMGIVTYGKNEWRKDREGRKKVIKQRDKSEWSTGVGEHEKLKTEDEHKKILEIMNRNQKIPRKSRKGTFALSGLVYCKKCGKRMRIVIGKEDKRGYRAKYLQCTYKDPYGNKCVQRGVKLSEELFDVLYSNVINNYLIDDKLTEMEKSSKEIDVNKVLLIQKKNYLSKNEKKLERIMEAYEKGVYTLEQFLNRKEPVEKDIEKLKNEVINLEEEIGKIRILNTDELEDRIKYFKNNWNKATTPKEQNDLLKAIVNKIYYNRQDDEVDLEIIYL